MSDDRYPQETTISDETPWTTPSPMAELVSVPQQKTSCLSCIGNWMQRQKDIREGVLIDGEPPEPYEIQEAITWAPSWQTQNIMGQVVVACVALPSCMNCLSPEEKSAAERATRSGLALPAPGSPFGGRN